jgi:hypothetical protein
MMTTKAHTETNGLREGEIAVTRPTRFEASLYFIGRIRTPWKPREDCPKNPRETDAVCTIELDPRWTQGLTGLETVTHIVVLYWMHEARRDLVLRASTDSTTPRSSTSNSISPRRIPSPTPPSAGTLRRVDESQDLNDRVKSGAIGYALAPCGRGLLSGSTTRMGEGFGPRTLTRPYLLKRRVALSRGEGAHTSAVFC